MKNLWGEELPEFESLNAANELIGVLVNGLWNSLTRHHKRSDPFRLVRPTVTLAMEREINRDLLDCTRARRQMLGSISNAGSTRH